MKNLNIIKCKYGAMILNVFITEDSEIIRILDGNKEFEWIRPFTDKDLHPFTFATVKLRNC